MEITHFNGEGYRLQPRVNVPRDVMVVAPSDTIVNATPIFSRLFGRSEKNCKETPESNTCEKPIGSMTVPIVLAVVIPIVLVAILLLYLHRRSVKRQRLEDVQDPHKSLDFGVAVDNANKKAGRKSLFMGGGEKGMSHSKSQLSMDMNLSSPYLLPPGLQQSRESLHSLARSLGPDTQDPYQYVQTYTNSETGSMRSFNPNKDGSSLYTKSSGDKHHSATTGRSIPASKLAPRKNSNPKSPISPAESKTDPFATPTMPEPAFKGLSPVESHEPVIPVKPIVPEIGSVSDYDEKYDEKYDARKSIVPEIRAPSPARTKDQTPHPFELPPGPNNIGMASAGNDFPMPPNRQNEPAGLGLNFDLPNPSSPAIGTALDAPLSAPIQGHDDYGYHEYQPEIRTSEYYDPYEDYERGRAPQRQGSPDAELHSQGLGVPQQDNKRLSVGFRPLPPDEITESEDPEYRANRIRSFYKEYFEDTKEAAPPVPPMPRQAQQQQPQQQQAGYYEDYDQGYLGEAAAYFDPETNTFVMPYSEPVTRRAMTPPPSGRNRNGPGGPGPRGPRGPHGPHGSVGGMSLPGGPRGRPRAGSAYGPRTGSQMSSRAGSSLGPRPDSSASARYRQPPKKKGPPPAPLTTLPTPSKLRDDSFALMGAIDFAPPTTFKDHAAGRSQSPLGERRPYSPSIPVATPLVTAFDELAALPSPHLLRKSGTFTALDFAPPKKFAEADDRSDAGSIRSNRSGISSKQLGAIRGGAGRVSRLPGDTVFTQASLQDTLKPQWGMRQ
ncbi:Fc.00g007820.m01.CDS01 [Cosmosporella sp. VM-42]